MTARPRAGQGEGDDELPWRALRAEFVLDEGAAYFNAATLAPAPRAVVEAIAASTRELARTLAAWEYRGDPSWIAGYEAERPLRARLAALIGGDADEVALTRNATVGLCQVALGIDLAAGDEVIQTDQEHPGGRAVWDLLARRRGVVRREVALAGADEPAAIVARVRAALTPRTRVLAWPHVTSALGGLQPVAALCALARGHGILTLIDGAQALGQIAVDVGALGCDAYAASPHKWLGAPAGSGLLWARRDLAARLWPLAPSQGWDDPSDPGRRLQTCGTGNASLLAGYAAALDLFERVGPARWLARVRALTARLRAGLAAIPAARILSPEHPELTAGITTWTLDGVAPDALQDALWRERIRVRAVPGLGVRQSTHVANLADEIDATCRAAARIAAAR